MFNLKIRFNFLNFLTLSLILKHPLILIQFHLVYQLFFSLFVKLINLVTGFGRCFELIILARLDPKDALVHQRFGSEIKKKLQ